MNYQIYDKELLAIVVAFKHWCHYLEFSSERTEVLTDHKNLEYFTTTCNLSCHQVHWSEILSDFCFTIKYHPGALNAAADALSQHDKPEGEGTPLDKKTAMTLLPPIKFLTNLQALPLFPESAPIQTAIQDHIETNEFFGPIFRAVSNDSTAEPPYSFQDGFLLQDGLLCVPNLPDIKQQILEECHESLIVGHFGIAKTHVLVSRTYFWPQMCQYIKNYVTGCDTCQCNKGPNHKPYGILNPLPVPDQPWTSISIDFITQLPPCKGFLAICVFVDHITKMAHFALTTDNVDAEGTVALFLKHDFTLHGLPDVVSDQGVTFTAKFTQEVLKVLKIQQKLSTAYHPQTDG
jgi:hypothetical protein